MGVFLISLALGMVGGWIGSTLVLLLKGEANRGTGKAGLVICGIAIVLTMVAIA